MTDLLDRAMHAAAAETPPRAGDDELIALAVRRAMSEVRVPRVRRSRLRPLLLAAAALVLVAGVSAGAIWHARPPAPPNARPEEKASAPAATALFESASPPPPVEQPPSPPRAPAPATVIAPSPSADLVTAASLFTRANEARRRGDAGAAAAVYLDLERRFPRSAEARVARVALGRLYLERLGDAASALAQFDAYLADGGGELDDEALVGRASSLERLGRSDDERRAWEKLLATHPDSMSADRARARLGQLR